MQGLVTLLSALGLTLFWLPEKRIAICSPPKVGTSFSHAWLVWSEVSPEAACRYGVQQLSSEARAFCHDAGIKVVDILHNPHNFSQLKMIRAGRVSGAAGEAGAYFQSLMPRDHREWRLFVLARDPWCRLMSGFSNKILGISGAARHAKGSAVQLIEIGQGVGCEESRELLVRQLATRVARITQIARVTVHCGGGFRHRPSAYARSSVTGWALRPG